MLGIKEIRSKALEIGQQIGLDGNSTLYPAFSEPDKGNTAQGRNYRRTRAESSRSLEDAQEAWLRAKQIKPPGRACQPGSDLPAQTQNSVWRSVYADLGIEFSCNGTCP